MTEPAPPMFVLCDFAEVLNGKLYIMGGGFNQVAAGSPFSVGLAILWNVPWDQTNQPHKIVIALLTEDGEPVLAPDGNPIRVDGGMEVGRPPGTKRGDPIAAPLAVRTPPIAFAAGGYRWELIINDDIVAVASLRAVQVGPTQ